MKNEFKKIWSGILIVLSLFVIIIASVFVYSTFSAQQNDGIPKFFGFGSVVVDQNVLVNVPNEFGQNDLVFLKMHKPLLIKVNDTVAFWNIVDSKRVLVFRKVSDVDNTNPVAKYIMKASNNNDLKTISKYENDIVGVYSNKIAQVGGIITFLGSKWGALFFMVIPLLLFFIWRLVKFILSVIEYKKVLIEQEKSE